MGGFDGIMGDWMPPSPSPRSFFSAILGYDSGSRSSVSERPKDDDDDNNINTSSGSGFSFPGPPDKQLGSENGETGAFGEQKASSRSGLVERMAARAGYNAPKLNTRPSSVDVPCFTIPPGLSPTSLLDSPVFLSNSLVQPSPTTGKFPFAPNANGNGKTSMIFSDLNTSSFAFKPVPESAPSSAASVQVNPPPFMSWQSFPSIESENPQSIDKVHSQNGNSELTSQIRPNPFGANNNGNVEKEGHDDEDADQISPSEDGYNWRKYGQKQVKGSEYPRSYYKCTHPNCPVKKKVERSHEGGHITEIIYKGAHHHPPSRSRSGIGSSTGVEEGDPNADSTTMDRHGPQFESSDAVDGSFTFSNEEEEEEDGATHGSVSLGYDGEGDETESKRRKMEAAYAADVSGCSSSRAMREPRVVVQTTSEVDILDDGYRWRKYGQKVVKGNPNPRSYYKCTSTGCTVRKHVERASHDLKSVITTYEGKHNHDVPAARNNNNNNHQSQLQNRIERRHDYGRTGIHHHHQYMLPKGEPVSDPYHHQLINNTFLPHI